MPAFTATVVVTLALGIGANSAVFSAIDAVLLRPLPFPNGDQLVKLSQSTPKNPQPFVAPTRLADWNRLNNAFQAITGYYTQDDSELSGELPEKLQRAFVAPGFLQVWGIAPALGRDFSPEEEHFRGPAAVLISDRLWHRRFSGASDVVGKVLRLNGSAYPIVGVMPASFLFPERGVDLWSPSAMDAPFAQSRELTWFTVIGRLKPGVTLEQARANLTTVQGSLGELYPKTDAAIRPDIQPLKELTIGGVRNSLWLLFGSVSLLLVIACTNIAALLLSRAAGREHEIAIRFALGASRFSVATYLFTEVLVLALGGAALGLLLASGAVRVFRALAGTLPRVEEIGLDWRIVLYTLGCAMAATVIAGLIPAIRGTRRKSGPFGRGSWTVASLRAPGHAVRDGGRAGGARGDAPGGRGPAGAEFSGAGTSLAGLRRGARADVPRQQYLGGSRRGASQAAGRQPPRRPERGARVDASATSITLPGVPNRYEIELGTVEGRADTEPKLIAQDRYVTPGYFATLRIPVLAGELCRIEPDAHAMMVNRSFATLYFAGSSPIGRHVVLPANPAAPPAEIRGIVGDARETGLDHEPVPTAYWCDAAHQPGTFFLVRTRGESAAMIAPIRRAIHEIEPQRSVYELTPLGEHLSDAYAENRLRTILVVCFALTAVSLACVGLYGTLSYAVSVRRREIGLRLALGALRTQVVRQFLIQGLRVSLLGGIAGLALATAFSRLIAGMLYGVSASDPLTLGGVVILMLAVSIVASLLPAIRAARLEPMQVLRTSDGTRAASPLLVLDWSGCTSTRYFVRADYPAGARRAARHALPGGPARTTPSSRRRRGAPGRSRRSTGRTASRRTAASRPIGKHEGAADANRGADGDHAQSAADHRSGQLSQLRAECDADADFLRALGHEEREQAVEPERRQKQSAERKCAGHQRAEPLAREALGDRVVERLDLADREVRIEVVERADGQTGRSPSADSHARTASSRSPASGDGCRTPSAARCP